MTKKYLTVTALTKYIKHKIDYDPHLQQVFVMGEISNFYLHRTSNHMYLTIKDRTSQIKAVMFRGDNRLLQFKPETGMSVYIKGSLSVYVQNGEYQLYIKEMEPAGIGALHLAFEQLKEKLQKGNFFAEEHKKSIPLFPKKIAVVTSRDSAAVRDIITTIDKRYPIVQLVILPVNVQGEQSASSIVRAISQANKSDFDTIIVARGGGSIEDLSSYNDERVAMAIFHSRIPIITGIGHETDTTISDFVADLRAPTPTGAAQYAVPSLEETIRTIAYFKNELKRLISISFIEKSERLKRLEQSSSFTYPLQLVREKGQKVDQLTDVLQINIKTSLYQKEKQLNEITQRLEKHHPKEVISLSLQKLSILHTKIENKRQESLQQKRHKLTILIEKLTLLNPLHIMKRGYTITYSSTNELVKSVDQLKRNDMVQLTLFDGTSTCEVKEVQKNKHE